MVGFGRGDAGDAIFSTEGDLVLLGAGIGDLIRPSIT